MAVMHPPVLPDYIRQDKRYAAEVLVYDLLQALDNSYHVFYSVKWLSATTHGATRDGETDFVIAHADRGLLVLEVKGGALAYRGLKHGWVSLNQAGRPRSGSRDPFRQAKEGCYALGSLLFAQRGWRHAPLQNGHAVVLTDTAVPPDQPLPPEANRRLIIDANKIDRLPEAVDDAFTFWQCAAAPAPLGADRLAIVIERLDGWITLPVRWSQKAFERHIINLTRQQKQLLDMLGDRHRALVRGCAGSGKTLLALDQAQRLAARGQKVLLTCFNKALGEHLRHCAPGGVDAVHYHEFCMQQIRAAMPDYQPPIDASAAHFDETLPALLVEAAQILGPRYDALLIDEAQDFRDTFWPGLRAMLRDPDDAPIFIFFDSRQDLFTDDDGLLPPTLQALIPEPPYELTRNCRSTAEVHRVSMACVAQIASADDAPSGPPITLIDATTPDEQRDAVERELERLIAHEKIAPADIVVLTGHANRPYAVLPANLTLGPWTLVTEPPTRPHEILLSTTQRFKGLERRAVIVADMDQTVHPNPNNLLHVACSRATQYLTVICSKHLPAALRQRLQAAAEPPAEPLAASD